VNGDAPTQPPYTFPTCCASGGTTHGTCVPATLLSASQASSLPQDTCPDSSWRCAPNAKVADPNASLPACSYGAGALACGVFSLGCPGACLHECFLDLGTIESLAVSRRQCASNHLCAPCSDPLGSGSTGACE
jgi:hypothetical protein